MSEDLEQLIPLVEHEDGHKGISKERLQEIVAAHLNQHVKDIVRLQDSKLDERVTNLEQFCTDEQEQSFYGLLEELNNRIQKVTHQLQKIKASDTSPPTTFEENKHLFQFWGGKITETLQKLQEYGQNFEKKKVKNLFDDTNTRGLFRDTNAIAQNLVSSFEECEITNKTLNTFAKQVETFLENNISTYNLPEDTTSLIMVNGCCSRSGALGFLIYIFQGVIIGLIFWEELMRLNYDSEQEKNTKWIFTWPEYPYKIDLKVRLGQIAAAILASITQTDLLESIVIPILRNTRKKDYEDVFGTALPLCSVALPNMLKFIIGLFSLVTSAIIIVKADNWLDLLKGYAALWFVSKIDNHVFTFMKMGYCGKVLPLQVRKVTGVEIEYLKMNWLFIFRSSVVIVYTFLVFAWIGVVWYRQINGDIFAKDFEYCKEVLDQKTKQIIPEMFGHVKNGICDAELNTDHCDKDGGDCDFTKHLFYNQCNINTDPNDLGNGFCQNQYKNPLCGWDSLDCFSEIFEANINPADPCPESEKENMSNGICDNSTNTPGCRWDGWDCFSFVFPHCEGNYTKMSKLANKECDAENNNPICAWDGWDCFEEMYEDQCRLVSRVNFLKLADGSCDPENSSPFCFWDGWDCFQEKYPNCVGDHTKISKLANGECDDENNNLECAWDGWDCFESNFPHCKDKENGIDHTKLADGNCHSENDNPFCAWDGWDCFHENFPVHCADKIEIKCNENGGGQSCTIEGPEECLYDVNGSPNKNCKLANVHCKRDDTIAPTFSPFSSFPSTYFPSPVPVTPAIGYRPSGPAEVTFIIFAIVVIVAFLCKRSCQDDNNENNALVMSSRNDEDSDENDAPYHSDENDVYGEDPDENDASILKGYF